MEDNSKLVLIIEDDEGLSELIAERMEENSYIPVCKLSAQPALDWLNENTPFLIILDFSLPGMNGKEFILELQKKDQNVPPFIVSTGQGDERVAVEMMKLGARDYIIKDRNYLEIMPIVVNRICKEIENEKKLKDAEISLRQRGSYLSAIIENQPGLVWLKNIAGEFLMANQSFTKFWGLQNSDEIVGKTIMEITSHGIAIKKIAEDAIVIKQKKSLSIEESFVEKSDKKWFVTYKFPIFNGDNSVIGTAGLSIDITERKLAEEKLKANEVMLRNLNNDKDRFMSILAHDLKSPFNCVVGLSEILVCQVKDKNFEGIEKYAEIIQQSSQQVMDLLNNLMEWSKTQTGRMKFSPENFDLQKLITEIVSLFNETAEQKSIKIKNLPCDNCMVFADNAMVSTILRNLISNAIKFTSTNGTITIEVLKMETNITVKVSDTGIGIPISALDKIFRIEENYTTTGTNNEQGTGLGLILCKEFAEKHGGKIWVESEVGKGSIFYFTIPI
jgi:PAS domain S-box-containing protein